jgi:hypothetical protein
VYKSSQMRRTRNHCVQNPPYDGRNVPSVVAIKLTTP